MKAIIVGATGATGKDLVQELIDNPNFSEIILFVRRKLDSDNQKITQHIINFDNPTEWRHLVKGDVLFSCLGTTLAIAGSKENQYKIDYTYQLNFAKIGQENGIKQYILVSAIGANSNSSLFYSKMKGELEDAIKNLDYQKITILQPPTLERESSDRLGEKIAVKLFNLFAKFGLFSNMKPIKTKDLAKVMLKISLENYRGISTLSPKEIWNYIK